MADIDDTLTTDGRITSDALIALGRLQAAGLHCILVTGRPVGWSEPSARDWPVDAIVAENGAVALLRRLDPASHSVIVEKIYQQDEATRRRNFERLQQVASRILREVPGTCLAQDSAGRETDIAVDHSEFSSLSPTGIEQVVNLMHKEGMNATVSSIHINGWYGEHNKLDGARWITRHLWLRDLDRELPHWVYVGDSTNDQIMFQHFPHSVGVANIRRFESELQHWPRYLCRAERGAGFAELTEVLLQGRDLG